MAQEKLPGGVKTLVLGAVSLACMAVPIVGLVLGIISRGGPSTAQIEEENPGKYTPSSLKLHKIGRILGLIGWPLNIVWIIFWIVYIIFIASLF